MQPRKFNKLFLVGAVLMGIVMLIALITFGVNYQRSKATTQEKEANQNRQTKSFRQVKINGTSLKAELASTPQERKLGLMYRAELNADQGMLFTFGSEFEYPFWMKNMKIPIDITWIDSSLTVVDLDENVPPCKQDNCELYTPIKPAKYVLETTAGWAKQHNVSIGTPIELGPTTVESN